MWLSARQHGLGRNVTVEVAKDCKLVLLVKILAIQRDGLKTEGIMSRRRLYKVSKLGVQFLGMRMS